MKSVKVDMFEAIMHGRMPATLSRDDAREALRVVGAIVSTLRSGPISLMGQSSEQIDSYSKSNALKACRRLVSCGDPEVEQRARTLIDELESGSTTRLKSFSWTSLRLNPLFVLLPALTLLLIAFFVSPNYRTLLLVPLCLCLIAFLPEVILRIADVVGPKEVPNAAVRLLLRQCIDGKEPEEWAIVRFTPGISLNEVQQRLNNAAYTEEDRIAGFMRKFDAVAPQRETVAVFYSSTKGIAVGKVGPIKTLVTMFGRWKLEPWRCLVGALRTKGMEVQSLDGSQTYFT